MSLKLSGIAPIAPIAPPDIAPVTGDGFGPDASGGVSFKDLLGSAISNVESARTNANQTVDRFLSGDGEDLHSTILASQRADLEFQMFLQVRNKVVSAYQEVMKMQL
jgi:flagellar hook-basal body complex protein FliE